ncbi:hypothetical protein L596_000376 [Steinernema carpocapsae]|uniref:7TM GPCR serpentine receptor class x (Srx) domain-containing protein n=1 Tax=Steinernema carpocapsae TaxID=34508 RepID=A0A4U8UIS8_STECR|nr:hypothetical protein L596_000376 [Steinernema carpocapsae]
MDPIQLALQSRPQLRTFLNRLHFLQCHALMFFNTIYNLYLYGLCGEELFWKAISTYFFLNLFQIAGTLYFMFF